MRPIVSRTFTKRIARPPGPRRFRGSLAPAGLRPRPESSSPSAALLPPRSPSSQTLRARFTRALRRARERFARPRATRNASAASGARRGTNRARLDPRAPPARPAKAARPDRPVTRGRLAPPATSARTVPPAQPALRARRALPGPPARRGRSDRAMPTPAPTRAFFRAPGRSASRSRPVST